jgi:hypothetical protein
MMVGFIINLLKYFILLVSMIILLFIKVGYV